MRSLEGMLKDLRSTRLDLGSWDGNDIMGNGVISPTLDILQPALELP